MPEEFPNDEISGLWRNQAGTPHAIPIDEVRRRAGRLEIKVRRHLRLAIVLLVLLTAGYGSFLYFFPATIQRIGATMTLAGLLFNAYHLCKRGLVRRPPEHAAMASGAFYRSELQRQREFHQAAWLRLIAIVPGPVVFIMGFTITDLGFAKAAVLAAVMAFAPFAAGIPLNRREARKLQREIEDVDALMTRT